SGRVPHRDVHITFTGLRPGEKIDEELFSLSESSTPTAIDKIRVVETNESRAAALEGGLHSLFAAVSTGNQAQVFRELRRLVPEYHQSGIELEVPITAAVEVPLAVPHAVPLPASRFPLPASPNPLPALRA
ncbi:MAG: polysaccharide biosynthesis protein, partial [bacterium]